MILIKPVELLQMYDFHDSLVKSIHYNSENNTVKLNIELCNWRQSNYSEQEPERLECELLFSGVSVFSIELSSPVDYDEILDIKLLDNNGRLKIILYNGVDVTILIINAREVNLIKNET